MSTLHAACTPPAFAWRILRIVALLALGAGCGDVAQNQSGAAACDTASCVDCADPCCYDLGYC